MVSDFGAKVKAAEREVKAKTGSPEIRRKRKAPKTAVKPGQRLSPKTEFKPGESGNPGGRPKKTPITDEFRRLLNELHPDQRKHKGKTYAQVLAEKQLELAIESGDMRAAQEIADRVEGKTVQVQQFQGPGGGAIPFTDVSPADNERRISELMSKAGGTTDGAD